MTTTVTDQVVQQTVIGAMAELGCDCRRITRETTLDSLELDSLDLAELSQAIQDELGVAIHEADAERIRTVGDAVAVIVARAS